MNCEEARRLIGAYSDGELDLVRSLEVEEHLRGCDSCALARENFRALKEAAQSAYFHAPDGLRESVLAAVRAADPIPPKRGGSPRSALLGRDRFGAGGRSSPWIFRGADSSS